MDLLVNALQEKPDAHFYLVEGFPRNVEQLEDFNKRVSVVHTCTNACMHMHTYTHTHTHIHTHWLHSLIILLLSTSSLLSIFLNYYTPTHLLAHSGTHLTHVFSPYISTHESSMVSAVSHTMDLTSGISCHVKSDIVMLSQPF